MKSAGRRFRFWGSSNGKAGYRAQFTVHHRAYPSRSPASVAGGGTTPEHDALAARPVGAVQFAPGIQMIDNGEPLREDVVKSRRLRNLIIRGIAMVDAGANQHARVVFSKRAGVDMTDAEKRVANNSRVPFDKLYAAEGEHLDDLLEMRGDPPPRIGPPRKSPAEVKQLIDSRAMMFWGARGYPPNGRAQAWVDARATPLDLSRPANSDNPTLEILESLAL